MFKIIKTLFFASLLVFGLNSCHVGLQTLSPSELSKANPSMEYWEAYDIYADTSIVDYYTACEGLKASKQDVVDLLFSDPVPTATQRKVIYRDTDCLFKVSNTLMSQVRDMDFALLVDRQGNVLAVRPLNEQVRYSDRIMALCFSNYEYEFNQRGPCLQFIKMTSTLNLDKGF